MIAALFMNMTCNDDAPNVTQTPITTDLLQQKKQEILNYVATFNCSAAVGCKFLAFGEKACGGPKEYLVFPESVDLSFLTNKVNEYNALEKQFNLDNNIVSDCMFVNAPTNVACVDGKCKIIP